MGRTATGVRGIKLRAGDEAVTLDIAVEGEDLLVVSENGIGKKTQIASYTGQNRGGLGKIAYKVTQKSGSVVAARVTNDEDEVMLINSNGIAIRIKAADISRTSRAATGVILMKSADGSKVVSMAKIKKTDDLEGDIEEIDDEALIMKDNERFDNDEIIDIDGRDNRSDSRSSTHLEAFIDDSEADDAASPTDELFDELDEEPDSEE